MNITKHPLLLRYQEYLNSGVYPTALDIVEALQGEGWHLEFYSKLSRVIFSRISPEVGFQILIKHQYMDSSTTSDYSFIEPANGSWMHIKKALSARTVQDLSLICDRLFPKPGIPPIQLLTIAEGQEAGEVFVRFGIVDLVKNLARQIQPGLGSSLTILGARTLLRRTYPISIEYKDPSRNMHNQDWHQDSNPIFGGRPMLTI